MCTLTAAMIDGVTRLAFNRDELITREPALPPTIVDFTGGFAAMPIDPISGGTWIAVNSHGLIFAILNQTPPLIVGRRSTPPLSRGSIIPRLVHHRLPILAAHYIKALNPRDYGRFRLIILGRGIWAEAVSDGAAIHVEVTGWEGRPTLRTSSGLGDHVVDQPRRRLFEMFATNGPWTREQQHRFHHHRWTDRPDLSVRMDRGDARTVSYTTVIVAPDAISMTYVADPVDRGAPVTLQLPLQACSHA